MNFFLSTASNRFRKYPHNYIYGGSTGGSYPDTITGRATLGRYWSATADSASNARDLSLGSSSVYPGTYNNYKYLGRAVR